MSKNQNKEKSLLQMIFTFAGEKKMYYGLSIVLAVLSVASAIAPYFIIALLVSQLLGGQRDFQIFLKEALIIAAFWTGNVVFHAISTTFSHMATFQVLGNIRKQMCDKLSRLPLGTVLDIPSGSLKNTIIERVDSMETTLAHILPEFTSNLLLPIALLSYLFVINWKMALASIICFPIGMIAMLSMYIGYEARFKRTVDSTKALNDTAVEYINGIEVIKAFGKSKTSYDKFVKAAKENSSSFIDWMRASIWQFTIALVIMPATLITVLPIGGFMVLNGSISSVDFITIVILSISLIQPLITVFAYSDDIAKAGVIFKEVFSILDLTELSRPKEDKEIPIDNSIKVKNLHFSYHKHIKEEEKKEILHGLSMDFPQGSYTALVGPSGSGKSTIARLIASLWDPDSGSIEIGGVDIKNLSLESYNKKVAYVSQDNFLFDMSIRENIRVGRPEASDSDVEKIAKDSGCYDFIMKLDQGFDTIVGGSGAHLSGGERQRIAIARAMMKNAPIVILDEATAYTDPENEAIIQKSVAKLIKGKTLIVIAHRLSTISDADRIYVIKDGNIDSYGTHKELLNKKGLYKSMWEAHIFAKDSDDEIAAGVKKC